MLVWNAFVYDARVTREANSLAAGGAVVRVVCVLSPIREVSEEVTEHGVEVVRVDKLDGPFSRLFFLGGLIRRLDELVASFRMARQAMKFRPDVVHANDVNTLLPAWVAARLSGAKLVYDAHEISADREGYRGRVWLVKALERWLGNRADGRLTTTRMRADWFAENYGFRDVQVVQNRSVFNIVRSNRIRESCEIPEHALVLLYQGGMQRGRGLRGLIRAIRNVPGVHLAFVGDGPQRHELERMAEHLSDRVHFLGQVPLAELPYWTASADVGVQVLRNTCLNHFTTESNKLFEYVMAGLPIIASDFPEIRSIVDEWALGILVDPADDVALTRAISTLAEDRALCRQYGSNSRMARHSLDWSSQEDVFLMTYRKALSS